MARPTKLTRETIAAFLRHIRAGAFVTEAADAIGVHRSIIYDAIKRGEAKDPPPGDAHLVEFAIAYRKADALAVINAVKAVRTGGSKWRGNAWWLERRHPERYGNRLRAELSGPNGAPIAIADARAALAAAIARVAEGSDPGATGGGSGESSG
jgi:hypothetical protein